jgi:hypothetical protein
MKHLVEYLTENKKYYSFKLKFAGDKLEADKIKQLKQMLEKYKIETFENQKSTPIQSSPVDFPTLSNLPVHIINVIMSYPVTVPELEQDLKSAGFNQEYFRVRQSTDPAEIDQAIQRAREEAKPAPALLQTEELDDNDSKARKNAQEGYYGDKYNTSFLQDLQRAADERKKELGHDNSDADVLGTALKETDKEGKKSPIGSK